MEDITTIAVSCDAVSTKLNRNQIRTIDICLGYENYVANQIHAFYLLENLFHSIVQCREG